MKRLLICLCLILVSAFCTPGFCSEKLTDNGLNLITTSNKRFNNPKDIVAYISGMEVEFDNFISQNEGKKQNSKLFGIYMNSLYSLRENLFELLGSDQSLYDYNIQIDSNHFAHPWIDIMQVSTADGLGIGFDYEYICDKYCSHLDKDWNKYIQYQIAEEKERKDLYTHDGEDDCYDMYMAINKKWIKNWTIFTMLNPKFPLNGQIEESIERLKYTGVNFNFKMYVSCIVIAGLIIIGLLVAVIFYTLKFSLFDKLITLIKNQTSNAANLFKSSGKFVIEHLKWFLIALGLIVIILLIFIIHNNITVPKCDSKFAEETVIKIFKNNDNIYQHNIDNVSKIKMSDFAPIKYDKEIGKYTCRGNLTMYAKSDNPIYYLVPFNSLKFNVYYEIYKERGKNTAQASWEMINISRQDTVK
jgi:hypothetical protein